MGVTLSNMKKKNQNQKPNQQQQKNPKKPENPTNQTTLNAAFLLLVHDKQDDSTSITLRMKAAEQSSGSPLSPIRSSCNSRSIHKP